MKLQLSITISVINRLQSQNLNQVQHLIVHKLNFLNTVIAKLVTSNCNTSKGCLDGSLSKTLSCKNLHKKAYACWLGWYGPGNQATLHESKP